MSTQTVPVDTGTRVRAARADRSKRRDENRAPLGRSIEVFRLPVVRQSCQEERNPLADLDAREFCAYLYRARGSLMELQTQLMIARELQYVSGEQATNLLDQCTVVGRSLAGLIHDMSAPGATAGA